jgi:hypothetical protein
MSPLITSDTHPQGHRSINEIAGDLECIESPSATVYLLNVDIDAGGISIGRRQASATALRILNHFLDAI